MKIKFWAMTIFAGIAILAGASFIYSTPAQAMSKADVEKIVADFITSNPKMIADTLDQYLSDQRVEKTRTVIEGMPTMGNPNASIVMIEFSDYRCGFCHRVQETLTKLRAEYKDDVLFAYKPMPILSDESGRAAQAAMAANKQGKFWEYNKLLWENQGSLGDNLYIKIAKDLKLNVDTFNKDRASDEILEQINNSSRYAQEQGATGTPFFIINGMPVTGAQPYEAFVQVLESLKQDAK